MYLMFLWYYDFLFHFILGGSKSDAESIKAKNIMQTELMIRLRDAILRVSRYFQVSIENNYAS